MKERTYAGDLRHGARFRVGLQSFAIIKQTVSGTLVQELNAKPVTMSVTDKKTGDKSTVSFVKDGEPIVISKGSEVDEVYE